MKSKNTKATRKRQPAPKRDLTQLSPEDVARAARAGLAILNYEQGAIPNAVRRDVGGLESILTGLAAGTLEVYVDPANIQQQGTAPPAPEE